MIPIVGNQKLCQSVQNFINEKRIPHAILIEGDFGTGKHTLARFLSSAAVCSSDTVPCNNCNQCHLASINSHPDIITILPEEGKKNISVDQIRSLRTEAYIKPHQAQKRVFIIDCADTMNPQAQNALLKVLEEPPKTVMFILIAENKASLLETILSRCITLSLTTPEHNVAFEYIKSVTDYSDQLINDALISEKNNIGKSLKVLNGENSSKTESAAIDFIKFALDGDQFSMLKILAPFSKSRIDADKLLKDLKYVIAKRISDSPNHPLAKPLFAVYQALPEFEASLATNINLNLLFCNLTIKTTELIRRNK